MRVKFVGDSAVEVPEVGLTVDPGQTIDVADDIGQRMVCSAMWQATTKTKPATSGGEE